MLRLKEHHEDLAQIPPASPEFLKQQRLIFATMEKYLDKGSGLCPFRDERCNGIIEEQLEECSDGWSAVNWVVMPNHLHLLARAEEGALSLKAFWQRFKGRTARACNDVLGRRGAFWQPDWFDRWMRSEAEERRVLEYIRQNPVKAGLVRQWEDYRWTR